ncbi:hypothetical protein GE061_013296 [Apolygus lucorum]|uniref:Uncharacterized protein n=1 Tax=Apolygus lucorum TaxID=248454 RepID=A0A6A4KFY3_APOLU|nr:hypothetical protein GE061_013296 [Apolygus lucorum]
MSTRDKDAGRRAKKKKRQLDTFDSSLGGNSGELSSKTVLDDKERACLTKIESCCVIYNFLVPDSDVEKKEAKTKTLMEILQFVHERDGLIPEPIFAGIVKMFSVNIFRNLPPNENSDFDPEEDEQKFDPAWPHLHIVYEIFLRCVEFGHFKIDHGKKYLTEKFIFSFLEMFNAEDPRERDMLKTILHRIYAKIVMIRLYIRKQMNYIFYRYIYEQESFNGTAELLEICGSIINGFNLPLKEEHKDFFRRILLPLFKTNHLSVFHPQLIYCIVQFLEKDPKLTETAITQMLRYWPKTCSHKEVIFLAGVEEIFDVIEPNQFVKIEVPLFQQIAKCIVSPHFQVAERALYFWNNEYLLSLLNKHITTVMPIVFPSVYKAKDHWNKAIVALAYNVLKSFMEMDSELFDLLIQPYLKKKGDDSQSDSEPGNYSSGEDT